MAGKDWRTADQSKLAPRDRTDTLERWDRTKPTLGFGVIAWMYDNLLHVDGDRADEPFRVTPRQAEFLLSFYQLEDDGTFTYHGGVRRLAKGSGKSPFAAAHCLVELLGPVRFDHFDPDVPGGAVGKPHPRPVVQIAATTAKQTENTMRDVGTMACKGSALQKKYRLDVHKTKLETPTGGILEAITSSPQGAEGNKPTFVIADETEHWTLSNNGVDLFDTLRRNSNKVDGRILQTCNAWVPGIGSIAETSFDAWVDYQEGLITEEARPTLYDAVIAPPNTSLRPNPKPGELPLREALEYVYEDAYWLNIKTIISGIYQGDADAAVSRQFYLNQPTAKTGAWLAPHEWQALSDPDRELIDGEEIVMFFDGSKSRDNSALVGCCLSDGHVFTIGVWEPEDDGYGHKVIDAADIDATVRSTRDRFTVRGFWADVREFESYVKDSWPALFAGDGLYPAGRGGLDRLIAFDMRSKVYEFASGVEQITDEIRRCVFTHDGDPTTTRHMLNAVTYEVRGRISIKKESPKSPRKVDAAVCVVGARMVYNAIKSDPDYKPIKKKRLGGWL